MPILGLFKFKENPAIQQTTYPYSLLSDTKKRYSKRKNPFYSFFSKKSFIFATDLSVKGLF